jgi:hypothetical protein
MPDDDTPRPPDIEDVRWGLAVLAAIIAIILVGWGWGSNGHGWGHDGEIAHMMPPTAGSSADGPATRAWFPRANSH